jgi:hypothetical protein
MEHNLSLKRRNSGAVNIMIGHIDEPATGKIIDSNDLICKGWVYSV